MALFFCFAAQFLRPLRTNPGPKSCGTKGSGKHNPRRAEFYLSQPLPAGPETARTAGRSGRAGALATPALSPAFFHTGPAPRPRKRRPRISAESGPDTPRKPPWGRYPYPALQAATQRLTGASSGDTCRCCLFLCIASQFLICLSFAVWQQFNFSQKDLTTPIK